MSNVETIHMNVGEILELAKWVEQKALQKNHRIEIEMARTSIGTAIMAKAKLTENEGIFIDITDYDSW